MGTNQKITATFSEPMIAGTITTPGTFTVTAPGPINVTGTVTYDSINNIATFAPTGGVFAANTTFTATITTAAESVSLLPWRVTTYGPLLPALAQTRLRRW